MANENLMNSRDLRNDSVRMIDGKAVGTVDRFEKGKVVVNYGAFITTVAEEQLELVKRAK